MLAVKEHFAVCLTLIQVYEWEFDAGVSISGDAHLCVQSELALAEGVLSHCSNGCLLQPGVVL